MIVEFIGCTGAGKTTLIQQVQHQMANVARVTTSVDLATSMVGLQRVTQPTIQNLVQEMVSFPFFISNLYNYREFLHHTIELLSRNSRFSIRTINNWRSIERKIGMYEIMSRYCKDRIILVDEGPLLAAHMFVFTDAAYSPEELTRFTDLLPLPDLVIYVRTTVDILVQRTLRRADPPREINTKDLAQTQRYAERAVTMFDQLVEAERIRCRLLIAESPEFSEQGYNKVVEDISQKILNHRPPALGNDK